jgi:glycosyltransferase involved in cell wall biosynthesis
LTIFYLQLRDFHEPLSLNHLLESLLNHCVESGISVNIIGYKQKTSPEKGAIPVSKNIANAKILNRRYQNKSSFFSRYLYECWLVIRAAFFPKLWKESDICLAYSFPSTFLYVWLAKVIYKKKAVFWVQDLWPDNAVEIGAMKKNSVPYRLFSALEKYAYRKADMVVTISEDIQQRLLDYGIPDSKVKVIHNWGYDDSYACIPWEENQFVTLAGLSDSIFYAVYAGNIGAVQNVELIVEAAALLTNRRDIRFLVIGSGLALDEVKKKAEGLDNVTFYPMQPPELAYHIYSAASVNLIPLKKGIIFTALPSKTAVLLACGKPVIACLDADSHYASLILRYGIGQITDPEDPKALAGAITRLTDTGEDKGIGEKVRKCFEEQFSKKAAFERFDAIFREL